VGATRRPHHRGPGQAGLVDRAPARYRHDPRLQDRDLALALLGAVGLLLVFALAFSWVSVLVGMLAKDPEKVQLFGFTALFPITFVSNVFVPAETMPGWLQAFVDVNPVTILADATRGLMVDGPVAGPVTGSLLWAAVIIVVFAPLSVWAFKRRV
jgi:oleandomycin transport system permease protein